MHLAIGGKRARFTVNKTHWRMEHLSLKPETTAQGKTTIDCGTGFLVATPTRLRSASTTMWTRCAYACAHVRKTPARISCNRMRRENNEHSIFRHNYPLSLTINGAPGEIRTPDRLVRSQVLYPAELRAHYHQDGALSESHQTMSRLHPDIRLPTREESLFYVAEREGFEPSMGSPPYTLSRGAPSASRPSLQKSLFRVRKNTDPTRRGKAKNALRPRNHPAGCCPRCALSESVRRSPHDEPKHLSEH